MRMVRVQCDFCGRKITKKSIHVNYARSKGRPLYCGYACSNKARRNTEPLECGYCHKPYTPKFSGCHRKFCSQRCAGLGISEARYLSFIERWKAGLEKGRSGEGGTSAHIKRYLLDKYHNKCSKCGWAKRNKYTGKLTLESHHRDGNWKNNAESNLWLLCPNCHSLTPTYRALNAGKGRR